MTLWNPLGGFTKEKHKDSRRTGRDSNYGRSTAHRVQGQFTLSKWKIRPSCELLGVCDGAGGPWLNKQGPPLCMLGKGEKGTNLDIHGMLSSCLTPCHHVSHTPAHRMKIASFTPDSISFPWLAITCQALEVDVKGIKMSKILGVPS